MVTSDSRTTVSARVAARDSRGRMSDAAANAAPPAKVVRRPNPLLLITLPSKRKGSLASFHTKRNGPDFRLAAEARPNFSKSCRRSGRRDDAARHTIDEEVGLRPPNRDAETFAW